ncbi:MAG: 16S rRNA processing protein RimM [candidate division Zixibacteria bacterium]|nr:16S rRNA processing protein RimM [candidate division Zixibacteria bacterium]
MERQIIIGTISKTHGVKGEVIIINRSRWYQPFFEINEVTAHKDGAQSTLSIEKIRESGGKLKVKFSGIDDPETAAFYRGAELKIPIESLPELPDNEYYAFEIEGFEVYQINGVLLGKVADVINIPANDIIVVESEKREEVLIPASKELVKEINLTDRKIIVELLEFIEVK